MKNAKQSNWSSVLKGVEKALKALPSDVEVKQSIDAIDSLVGFLTKLREILTTQPSEGSRQDVLKATNVLSSFLSSHTARLLLEVKITNPKSTVLSEHDASHLFNDLQTLPLPEVQKRLLDRNLYSTKDLKSLGKYLGISIDKSLDREDIADTIFKRGFANPRAYDSIGGAASQRVKIEAREQIVGNDQAQQNSDGQ